MRSNAMKFEVIEKLSKSTYNVWTQMFLLGEGLNREKVWQNDPDYVKAF